MYQPQIVARVKSARVTGTFVLFTKSFLLVSCLLLGFSPLQSMAQTPSEIDLANFSHVHSVSGGTLNANQAGTLSFELGSLASPAADVLGLRLDIELSDEAVLPTSSLVLDFDGSWLCDGLEVSQSVTVNGSTRILHIELALSDNVAQSGYGLVLSFPLVSAFNNVAASSLVANLDGIVIVENIDMKRAAPLDVCYPNPSSGMLHVAWAGADRLRLVGMDGRCWDFAVTDVGGVGVADIAPLARGMYVVEVLRGNVVLARQRVMRE